MNGIIFLAAFTTMVILIVWVIWKVIRDQKAGISYLNRRAPAAPIGHPVITEPNATRRWQGVALGCGAVAVGGGLLYIQYVVKSPLVSSSVQLRTTASGIMVCGLLILYKNWWASKR